jgi:ABC-type polysaccharide/polyol phosphate export permease
MANVIGVFIVLCSGCGFATTLAILEFFYRVYKQAKELQVLLELIIEWIFFPIRY